MHIHLESKDVQYLQSLMAQARQPQPFQWQAWYLRGMDEPLGVLSLERAEALARAMPQHMPLVQSVQGWVWHANACSNSERSQVLQNIARDLHKQGEITGWRDETYACWGWLDSAWPYARPELFRLERAAFRYFGLRSHAAHVHGITSDGRMWCGRRSMNKATDPGLLDNLAAGGLPSGEQPQACAVREVFEEAGLTIGVENFSAQAFQILTERAVVEGWHSESLFVYKLPVSNQVQPVNRDGEVSEFLCLNWPEVIQRIRQKEFTADAACAIAAWALSGDNFKAAVLQTS